MSTTKTVSQYDLILAARAAAQGASAAPNPDAFTKESTKLEAFKNSGFDAADFPMFETAFYNELEAIQILGKQDAPSVIATKKAAAKLDTNPTN